MRGSLSILLFCLAAAAAQCNPPCAAGMCCSKWGYCGTGPSYCGGSSTSSTTTTSGTTSSSGGSTTGITTTGGGGSNPPTITGPKYVVYVDAAISWSNMALSFNVPGHGSKNAYNVMVLAFWLSSGAADMAVAWSQLDDSTKTSYLNSYHNAGMRVIVSAFGATEFPTTAGADPVATAQRFASFVTANRLDGADVDYEDSGAFTASTGAKWLVSFQRALRAALPSPRYVITHAPQGPYFKNGQYPDNAYLTIHSQVGSGIDWYNVQFYNQATTTYATCDTLLNRADGWSTNTALFELIAAGIPANKIIIGKPISQADVYNTGYMTASALAACGRQAKAKGWNGGYMGWQFNHDASGAWINTLAASLSK